MKKYLDLELEIVTFLGEDIITSSDEANKDPDPYDPENNWWD